MVSTFTPNINLEEPARGDQVGTWDTPVNYNMTLLDLVTGGTASLSLNNSPVVLASAQYEAKTLVFSSTLTGNVDITFPSSFTKSYEILHQCTGSSAFVITLKTTLAGAQAVCAPPGVISEIANIGGNIFFRSLGGPIGSYWDYAGSSVPNWVSGCSVPPYLAATGGTFSATTYPQLAVILGSTTLPDSRGRSRFALDGGAGRISSAATGFSGSSVGSAGGGQTTTLGTSNLPPYTPSGSVASNLGGSFTKGILVGGAVPPLVAVGGAASGGQAGDISVSSVLTGNAQGGTSEPLTNLPPAYIGGIVMIRAG
jgi:hypothetical protein